MNRSGVALLITLLFIAAMMALAATFFALSNRAFSRVAEREATVQTHALLYELKHHVIGDLIDYAKAQTEPLCVAASDQAGCRQEMLATVFDGFYGLPLTVQTGPAVTVLSCQPAGTQIDINSLKLPGEANASAAATAVHYRRTKVERYLQETHRLYATWQLLELLDFVFDTTGQRYAYLKNDNRLNIARDRFERGRIGSLRQLRAIVEDYALLSNDHAALEVPWEKLFAFESLTPSLDFDHLAPEACAIAFAQTPGACEQVGLRATRESIETLSAETNSSITHFNMRFGYNPVLDCRVSYHSGGNRHVFTFGYDADHKRLSGFSMGF